MFHQSWTEKLQADLQLSTKDGEISIKLDLQLGRPEDIMPGPSPQATLPAHHNDVDLVVVEGQPRKSGQDSEPLLITLLALVPRAPSHLLLLRPFRGD